MDATVLPEVTAAGVIVKAVLILAVVAALAGFGTYIERKILAFMQRRLGPMASILSNTTTSTGLV